MIYVLESHESVSSQAPINVIETSVDCTNESIPANALINGLYQGSVPFELSDLNWYERSMISIYSCISRVKVLSGKHYKKCGTAYTIVNDLVKVTEFFPRMLNYDEFALLRHETEKTIRDYKFNPKKVWQALQWLRKNNHLYKDINLASEEVWPPKWRETPNQLELPTDLEDVIYIELTDQDVAELDDEYKATIVNDESHESFEFQQEREIFLSTEASIRTHEENLTNALSSAIAKTNILNVTTNHEFVNPYHDPIYFWAKCFPWLYPYGLGCPSDKRSSLRTLGAHTKLMLMRGGGPQGRRFQQCPNYYFAALHYESRRRISGVSSQAQNSKFDKISDEGDIFTADNLSRMISYFNDVTSSEPLQISESLNLDSIVHSSLPTPEVVTLNEINSDETLASSTKLPKMTKEEFEHYSKRLGVYGKSLPGTALHMKNERNNLMSMLASPSVEEDGIWRWFVTFSPADLFDPRLYEVLAATDEEFLSWESRKVKAREMSKETRMELLSLHPALAARLFDMFHETLWECVIGKYFISFTTLSLTCIFINVLEGENSPLGVVVDFFRRVEFQMRGTPHYHILVSVKKDAVGKTDIESNILEIQKKVTDLVKNVVTANLVKPVNIQAAPYVFHNAAVSDESVLSFEKEEVVIIYTR